MLGTFLVLASKVPDSTKPLRHRENLLIGEMEIVLYTQGGCKEQKEDTGKHLGHGHLVVTYAKCRGVFED